MINSDAHFHDKVGAFRQAEELLKEIDFLHAYPSTLHKDDKNLSQYQAISMLDRQPRMLINILIFFLESHIYCLLSFLAKVKQKWSNQYSVNGKKNFDLP